jgi:hypothetical protein
MRYVLPVGYRLKGDASLWYNLETSSSHVAASVAPLAQLDRAFGYEPKGREFESLRAHHSSEKIGLRLTPVGDYSIQISIACFFDIASR